VWDIFSDDLRGVPGLLWQDLDGHLHTLTLHAPGVRQPVHVSRGLQEQRLLHLLRVLG
jgi:hypothetical protein